MFEWLKGKKTYFIAIIAGVLAVLQSLGYNVPPEVYAVLGSLGLATLRAGVEKSGR